MNCGRSKGSEKRAEPCHNHASEAAGPFARLVFVSEHSNLRRCLNTTWGLFFFVVVVVVVVALNICQVLCVAGGA